MSKLKQARLSLPPLDFSTPKDKQVINTPNSDQPKVKQQKDYSKTETQSDKMLLCIDWDGTIVKGSLHNDLNATLNYQDCVDRFLADETKNWKNKELLVKLLQKALTIGCHIAIVSFGSYPDWIKYALEQLALESTLLEKIYVVSHPRRDDYEGKQEHIEEAKRHFGVSKNEQVTLIDDDSYNVDIARKNGMRGIYVTKEGIGYLNEASEIVTAQEPKENQNNVNIAKKNDMQGIHVEGIEYLNKASEIVTTQEQEQKENQIQINFDQPTESKLELLDKVLPSLGDLDYPYDTL